MPKNNKRKYLLDDEDSKEEDLIEVINNHIYFYCNVSKKSILNLTKHIRQLNIHLLDQKNKLNISKVKIFLHINSNGGEVFAALSAIDTIKSSTIPIVSIIEGCAASAATLVSIVCKERHILPNASMLIHQISSGFWGKYFEMKDEFQNLTYLEDKTKQIYKDHSNGKLKEKKLKKMLKRDLWWDAEKCLKLGLVDKIIKNEA